MTEHDPNHPHSDQPVGPHDGAPDEPAAPTARDAVTDRDSLVVARMLTTHLRRLRTAAGLSQRQAAIATEWSVNKVNRIENGESRVQITDLNALMDLYQLTDPQHAEQLRDWARQTRRPSWTHPYAEVIDRPTRRYLAYETSAARVLQVDTLVIPGAIRTEHYHHSVGETPFGAPQPDAEQRRLRAQLDRARRERTLAAGGPQLTFVLDEQVLLCAVGGIDAMSDQLRYLQQLVDSGRVRLHVIPVHQVTGPIRLSLLDFDPPAAPMVVLHRIGLPSEIVEDPAEQACARRRVQSVIEHSTTPNQAIAVLDRAIRRLQEGTNSIVPPDLVAAQP